MKKTLLVCPQAAEPLGGRRAPRVSLARAATFLVTAGAVLALLPRPTATYGNAPSPTVFYNRNIDAEAHQAMIDFVSTGYPLTWVAFPPGGSNHWSVAAGATFFNRNIPQECHDKMVELTKAGQKIVCVAFPPQGGNRWSVVTDQTFFNRNIPQECHDTMAGLLKAGRKILCVAFPPQGGNSWSIVTDDGFLNRNIPQECHDKMVELAKAGHHIRCVAFPPQGGNRWSIVTDKGFFNRNIPDECHMIMGELNDCFGPLRLVAFDGDGNGWSIVATNKPVVIYRLPFDPDPAWQLWNGNWDDPIAGHGKGDPNSSQAYAFDFVHDADHNGVGEEGQHIRAARAGTVIAMASDRIYNTWNKKPGDPGYGAPGEGNYVLIRHSDGTVAAYDHLMKDKVFVQNNQQVARGQIIALSGNTGNSSTPHVHFDLRTYWNSPTDLGPTIPIRFEDDHHVCWRPKVGDTLASNNN